MLHEVIPSVIWRNASGRTASIYGALPWRTDAQRIAEGWERVERGWTVRNPLTGQVGIGKPPCATRAEAEALVERLGPCSSIGIGD